MNFNTPIAEVAHYLAPETAELLMWEHPAIQTYVLALVRAHIIRLEEKDTCLDPITLSTELHSLVKRILGLREEDS